MYVSVNVRSSEMQFLAVFKFAFFVVVATAEADHTGLDHFLPFISFVTEASFFAARERKKESSSLHWLLPF